MGREWDWEWEFIGNGKYATIPYPFANAIPRMTKGMTTTVFLRISRNQVQTSNPHLNKSFGMNVVQTRKLDNMCQRVSPPDQRPEGWGPSWFLDF